MRTCVPISSATYWAPQYSANTLLRYTEIPDNTMVATSINIVRLVVGNFLALDSLNRRQGHQLFLEGNVFLERKPHTEYQSNGGFLINNLHVSDQTAISWYDGMYIL